ncbi:MAG: NAD-dependent epimerase/dehydratase family protein [Flavobacteriales bacterium]|mgnify:FL=1|jgi:dTDP-L-rhamnose 4-epimerase|nr:NAD-dependent epimerase/dehydratase family protein [Flavobacteriales bacterium]MBT4479167.1 NAD-dependent epimerase/dehydratase family protein [Flavobacteriales bacterium]
MKNILISGGAGFIGSNLTKKLVSKGYNITILDNLSKQIHGKDQKSELYNSIKEISTFILGDVCNEEDWKKSLKGQDAVIHLAAETGTGQSMYEISRYNDVNILGTSHLLDFLANNKNSVKKLIIASSRSIYGEGKYKCENHGVVYPNDRIVSNMMKGKFDLFCDACGSELNLMPTDENSKIHPSSIYGITKQQQEQMTLLMGKSLGIPAVALRYQNVYGPGQSLSNPYTGILSIFSTRMLNGNDIDIYEDGEESRDFVFIDDVVEATILALEKEEANHQIFNVGSGETTSVSQVANSLKKLYDSNVNISIGGSFRLGDIRHNYADLNKIKNLLGFTAKFDFQTGISRFADWVKTQEVKEDKYEQSLNELKNKGLIK